MRKDAVFVNAVCKAEEKNLLSYDALLRLSAATIDEAIKMLHDYGYNEGIMTESSFDIDRFISGQVRLLIDFIRQYSPTREAEDFLLARFLFNDIKAEYKRKRGASASKLYDSEWVKGISEGDYSVIGDIAEKLYKLDEKECSSGEIDLALTKAMYDYKLGRAKKSKSSLLVRYAKAEIDVVNLVTSIRAEKLHLSDREKEDLFIHGGNFSLGAEIPKQYERFDFDDLTKLETQSDNYLLEIASSRSGDMDSIGPMLGYTLCKFSEFKTVKMILVCIKSNARNAIQSRLRGLV